MTHTSPQGVSDRTGLPRVEAPTSLETLLDRLQGGANSTLADSGIARFSRADLDRIAGGAAREREACEARIQCLLELLDAALAGDRANLPETLVLATVQQVLQLLKDVRRWHQLADNAAYYRDHPEVAARIARFEAG